jgi:hypothetical protein
MGMSVISLRRCEKDKVENSKIEKAKRNTCKKIENGSSVLESLWHSERK